MTRCGGRFDIDGRIKELATVEAEMGAPGFWDNQDKAKQTVARLKALKALIDPAKALERLLSDLETAIELAKESEDMTHEAEAMLKDSQRRFQEFELQTLFDEQYDHSDCFLKIQAGTGGTEAMDWSQMLQRMYLRYCERRGFKVEMVDEQPGEEAGIKSCVMKISGDLAYGLLRNEMGVHRLVRPSPFNADNKRQTSFAAVEVTPVVEDVDVQINWAKDVREDTFCAGGKGGQHVNKTESAIRLTHLATGIVVANQNERSQHANRERARQQLMAKLYQYEQAKRDKELAKLYGEKGEVAWGSQIRSYVLDDRRVKDHRTNFEDTNTDRVLDGELDGFIEAQIRSRKQAQAKVAAAKK